MIKELHALELQKLAMHADEQGKKMPGSRPGPYPTLVPHNN